MTQDHSPAVIAAAKALAERRKLSWRYTNLPETLLNVICEALSTTLPSEEAMSAADEMRKTARELRGNANGDCRQIQEAITWEQKAAALEATPKPEPLKCTFRDCEECYPNPEPAEDHLRRACEELNATGTPSLPGSGWRIPNDARTSAVRTVARLLAERDAAIKNLGEQFVWMQGDRDRLARELEAALAERDAMQARVGEQRVRDDCLSRWLDNIANCDLTDIVADGGITAGMVVQQEAREQSRRIKASLAEPTPDPDLVLAREAAAQEYDALNNSNMAGRVRARLADGSNAVQSALRALKLAKEQG